MALIATTGRLSVKLCNAAPPPPFPSHPVLVYLPTRRTLHYQYGARFPAQAPTPGGLTLNPAGATILGLPFVPPSARVFNQPDTTIGVLVLDDSFRGVWAPRDDESGYQLLPSAVSGGIILKHTREWRRFHPSCSLASCSSLWPTDSRFLQMAYCAESKPSGAKLT